MPIHRGPRLDDMISRLPYAQFARANIYQTWPNLGQGSMITVPNGPNVYSSWIEYISAASAPTVPFTITHVSWNGGEGRGMYVQIGTGASGSEIPVAMSSGWGYGYEHERNVTAVYPLARIPGGTRIAIRVWSDSGAGPYTNSLGLRLVTCRLPPPTDPFNILRLAQKLTTASLSDAANGALVGAGATSNVTAWTYGNYSQVFDGTVESRPLLIPELREMFQANANPAEVQGQTAWAYGASGSETIWGEFPYDFERSTYPGPYGTVVVMPIQLPFPVILPGNTRLAIKAADSVGGYGLYSTRPMLYPIPGSALP